jgi:hypothetical protein
LAVLDASTRQSRRRSHEDGASRPSGTRAGSGGPEDANADPTDLDGCALIAHHVPGFVLSENACDDYYLPENDPLTCCEDQINRIDTEAYAEAHWFVIAAFDEDKEWCGAQFGFSDHGDIFVFVAAECGACFPPGGGIEIPSPGWPGPNEGNAFVTLGTPWIGNFIPIYHFYGFAYGYGAPGVVQLTPDPTVAGYPFAGLGNCTDPPIKYDAHLGGLGVNMDGIYVCGEMAYSDPSVCCHGVHCWIVYAQWDCEEHGGEWHPEWHHCDPNPCSPSPAGAASWGAIKSLYR